LEDMHGDYQQHIQE